MNTHLHVEMYTKMFKIVLFIIVPNGKNTNALQ